MSDRRRRIEVRLEGSAIQAGRVPTELVVRTVKVIQDGLYVVGRYELDQKGWAPGRIPAAVKSSCELDLVTLAAGSAVLGLELHAPSQEALFPELNQDLGEQSIGRYGRFVQAIERHDLQALHQAMPDSRSRAVLLRSIGQLSKSADGEMRVFLAFGDLQPVTMDARFARSLAELIREPEEAPVTVLGRMVMVAIEPSCYFALVTEGRRIHCYFEEDAMELVIPALGELVEVSGHGSFSPDGTLHEITQVESVEVVDLLPLTITELTTPRRRFKIRGPLTFELSYAEGMLVAENADLGTLSYGTTREALLEDIGADFDELWDMYVQAPVDQLSADAVSLRQKLEEKLELVGANEHETP